MKSFFHVPCSLATVLLLLLVFSLSNLTAQQKNVVYLRNGSVIKGIIVELILGKSIKIMKSDSTIVDENMDDVRQIVMEPELIRKAIAFRQWNDSLDNSRRKVFLSIYGGFSFPTGKFHSTSGADAGVAKMGYLGAIELVVPITRRADFLVSGLYCENPVKKEAIQSQLGGAADVSIGTWSTTFVSGGVRLLLPVSLGTWLYVSAKAGLVIVGSPELGVRLYGINLRQSTSSASSFASSVGAGIIGVGKVNIGIEYLMSKPKFHVSLIATPTSGSGYASMYEDLEQAITMIRVTAGFALW